MAKAPPPPSEAAANLVAGASANTTKYQQRALGRAQEWFNQASGSGPTWQQGVTQAGPDRFAAGIRKAGAQGYSQGIQDKGAARYASGVQAGQTKYARNVAPYFQVITSTQLPPRGLRGSPANDARVSALARALNAARVGGRASGVA